MTHKIIFSALAFIFLFTAGAKAQTGEIGLELMWEKWADDMQHESEFVEFSHDGQYIYSVSQWPDSTLVKIDANTGELVHRFDNSSIQIPERRGQLGYIASMEIAPDGSTIVGISYNGVIFIWNTVDMNMNYFDLGKSVVHDFSISADSRYLFVGQTIPHISPKIDESHLLIYDMVLDSIVGEIEGLKENKIWEISEIEISNTGDSLFVTSLPFELDERQDRRFAMINTNTMQVETILDSVKYRNALKISKTGKRIAVAPYDNGWITVNTSTIEDTIHYDGARDLGFINDSLVAVFVYGINGVEIDRLQLWKNDELLSYYDDNYLWDICTYEDENGFKVCITGNGWTKMFRGVVSGISEDTELGISIYPNPARDKLNLELNETSRVNSIAIYDVLGRKINTYQPHERELNISNLPKGIYLLKIETESGIISEKVVVE